MVKNPSAMQETQVLALSQKDPLEEEMATHSSILAWEIPWTEKPGGLQSMGLKKSRMTEHTHPTYYLNQGPWPPCITWLKILSSENFVGLYETIITHLITVD